MTERYKKEQDSQRKYRLEHKEELKEYRKKYNQEHKEQQKQYKKEHREKISRDTKIKLQTDINYKLSFNLRHRIWCALKQNTKSLHTIELIGCSIEDLKSHLENQFTKGMTWKNYGKWHVDHIKQCCTFDLSKKNEQLKCFNYTNLRPLWATENLERPKRG